MIIKIVKKLKFLIGSVLVLYFINNTLALENIVKIRGITEFQRIYYKNNGNNTQQKTSVYQKRYGFYSAGNFLVDYKLVTDTDVQYGASIGLQQTK